jgi:fumarate reductase subunit D
VRRSYEPFFWSIFSAGGMVTALVMPALILLTGFLLPAGWVEYERLRELVTNPFGRLAIFGVALLTFFHWAHRFRHALVEMGLRRFAMQIAVLCYVAAVAGSAWAGVVAFG